MKKRIFAILFAVVVCFASAIPIFAAESIYEETSFVPVERTFPFVVDNADLLTDSQEADLNARLEAFADENEMEAAILTVPDLGDKTAQQYADDFYDYNGFGFGENDDGLLVLYKPGLSGDRELYISTHGSARRAFSDDAVQDILISMKDDLIAENYVSAFNTYIDKCEKTVKPMVGLVWIPICLVIGFTVSIVIVNTWTGGSTSVKAQRNAANYTRTGSMTVTGGKEDFLYSNIARTPKVKVETSSHTSSSGRSHGGGGISF